MEDMVIRSKMAAACSKLGDMRKYESSGFEFDSQRSVTTLAFYKVS